ncbi:MAG: hypothetical protein ACLSA6_08555 [Holdemania massiliensis]
MALPRQFSQFTTTATLGKIESAVLCCRYVPEPVEPGGLLADDRLSLDQDNKPIAGLYAVGTCSPV